MNTRTYSKIWLIVVGVLLLVAFGILTARAAGAATGHSPKVTATCTTGGVNTAHVTVYNGKQYGTGWMYGWAVDAVTTTGKHVTDVNYGGDQFRVKAWSSTSGDTGFGPHHLASCTATILWTT